MSADRIVAEVAVSELLSIHWDGTGCGSDGPGACSNCYGPSPMTVAEVVEAVLDSTTSRILEAERERIAEAIEAERDPQWTALPAWGALDSAARIARSGGSVRNDQVTP